MRDPAAPGPPALTATCSDRTEDDTLQLEALLSCLTQLVNVHGVRFVAPIDECPVAGG